MKRAFALLALLLLPEACGAASTRKAEAAEAGCLAPIESAYFAAVLAACPDRSTRKECYKQHPELAANRLEAELAAGCR